MVEEETIITYETLYDLLRNETYKPELQKLDPEFYKTSIQYLKEKKGILESQEKKESIFSDTETEKTSQQVKSILRIIKELYEKREAKIIQLALVSSRTKQENADPN